MADIQAQTPDGVTHSFPDGTPDDVIDRVVKNHIQNVMPYTEKGAAGASPAVAPRPSNANQSMNKVGLFGEQITPEEEQSIQNRAASVRNNSITPVTNASSIIMPTAGAAEMGAGRAARMVGGSLVGGAVGAPVGSVGARRVASAFGASPQTQETVGTVGGIAGSLLGAGVGGYEGYKGLPEETTLFGTKFKTPNVLRRSPFEPSEGYSNPLGPDKGEFEAQQEAQLTKEGKLAKIPARMPKPATTPEDIANRSIAVGKAKSQIVSGRPFEQLNEQEQAEALMRRGREQQQIEAGAPVEGSNQRPITVPEPNPVQPGEKPGAQWSVKRRTDLIQNAKRGKEGAATVLNQLNKPVIYEPRGVVGTNPREVTKFGEGGAAPEGTVGKGPIKGGKASLEGMGKGEQARAQLHAQLEKDTGVNVHDFVDKFMEKNPKATRGQAYDIAEETLRDLSGGKYVNEIERQMSQERLNRIMGPEQRGPQRLGPEYRGTK